MSKRVQATIVPIVVVVVIIGALVALILPATQSAREAANRIGYEYDEPASASALPSVMLDKEGFLGGRETAPAKVTLASTERRIVYEAQMTLVVDDLPKTEKELTSLVQEQGGYFADASVDRQQGERLSGRWQVRIPVAQFEAFLDAVSKLGVPEVRRQTAQDVTEEFVDLKARIANKKRLEDRIVELLDTNDGKIKDVIEVERELARVRSEIEQMEGRLRYLTDRTEMTTVTITAREERDYVPPKAPTFGSRISGAWSGSLLALRKFGENFVVAIVYLGPWLVIGGVLFVPPVWWIYKRSNGKAR